MTDESQETQDPNISEHLASVMEQALRDNGTIPGGAPPDPQPPFVDNLATDKTPAMHNIMGGVSNDMVLEMADAMRPLAAEEFDIDVAGQFGWNLPDTFTVENEPGEIEQRDRGGMEQQKETEDQVRGWMAKAQMNAGEAGQMKSAFQEVSRKGMTDATEAAYRKDTMSILVQKYGMRAGEALKAADRVVFQAGGEDLRRFLSETRLGSHPTVVQTFINKAIKAGLFHA